MGYDPDSPILNREGFGHSVLRKAMLKTIKKLNALIAAIPDKERKEREEALDCRSLFEFRHRRWTIGRLYAQAVMIHPIIDEYYNHNPSYTRSTGFAVSKGLDITTAEQKEGGAVNGAAE
ncbi:MAG: hypothetical protein L6R37_008174 [Teloschistes peruensis]|nr:MAG: hypothetical protein L6R37_008174 [Teloschistes peruensis]